ncbi:MAG: ATP-binding protein [Bacteroidota bacterium]
MHQVIDFFQRLFEAKSWPPRWYCGQWTDFHGWLYIVSDVAIWAAYFAIPVFIFSFLKKKKNIPLPTIFWLFMAFILLCGLTHIVDAAMFWFPYYRVNALFRFVTGIVSWVTVISLVKVFPEAIKLKTSADFEKELEERKKIEEQLLAAKEMAERSEKAKEQFLANMSHEIRTPMNAIIGFAQLLDGTKLSEEQQEYVHVIEKAGNNLIVVINDILDLAKIEAGKMQFESTPLDIPEQLSGLRSLFAVKAEEKGLELKVETDPAIPEGLLGDGSRLSQILINLVSNAIKFTPSGSVKIRAELLDEQLSQAWVKFSVTDSGIGISEDRHEAIFKRFTQAADHTSGKYGGTGLGLTIVKHMVELQHGTVEVSSAPGQGSVFSVILPFPKPATIGMNIEPRTAEGIGTHDLSELRVLVVEDNEVNRKLMQILLREWGVCTDFARNGIEAISKVQDEVYDLVFMDIQMPEMGGYQATRIIRKRLGLNTPIIALSAHAMAEETEKSRLAGMDGFIAKPFRKEDIYDMIVRFAGLKHAS